MTREKDSKSTMDSAEPPAGRNLTEKQRKQMELQGQVEHEDGRRKERLSEEAEELDEQ